VGVPAGDRATEDKPAGAGRDAASAAVADAHRHEWAFVLAATARVAGDLGLAEDSVQDAYATALDAWTRQGIPRNPGAWLTTAARRRAIDLLRRDRTLRAKLPLLIGPEPPTAASAPPGPDALENPVIADDRLRLVFTCCHPALARDAQVALTLRLVCGLTTGEIAQAFLVSEGDHGRQGDQGEEEDRRRADPLPGAPGGRTAGPARLGAHRRAPAVHHRAHRPGRPAPGP